LHQQAAYEKLISLLSSLRESVSHLTNNLSTQAAPVPNNKTTVSEGDVEKLQATINSLRTEIGEFPSAFPLSDFNSTRVKIKRGNNQLPMLPTRKLFSIN
jgi:hypothetical protein